MTNEAIVKRIKNDCSVTENLQLLYEKNLPYIKKICKPYEAYEPLPDLLQEAFFGLYEAVYHYETSENVKFMYYASYWIKQAIISYIEKCGNLIRVPNYMNSKMLQYKKVLTQMEMERGKIPNDEEVSSFMGISLQELNKIKSHIITMSGFDTKINENEEVSLLDTLKADINIENEVVNKLYNEQCKTEVWDIVERYTEGLEKNVIVDYFKYSKSLTKIAEEYNLNIHSVRRIKEKGLQRLRVGKAYKKLLLNIEQAQSKLYKTGFGRFENEWGSSIETFLIDKENAMNRYLNNGL